MLTFCGTLRNVDTRKTVPIEERCAKPVHFEVGNRLCSRLRNLSQYGLKPCWQYVFLVNGPMLYA